MHALPLPSAKSAAKSADRLYRRLFRKFCLIRLIRRADFSLLSPEEVARDFFCTDEKSVARLLETIGLISERLRKSGKLSEDRFQAITDWRQNISPAALGETLSPYHSLLSEKPFYRLSDAPTRRRLRKNAARFAAWHRLSPESAVLLWKGELPRPHYSASAFLFLAIPASAVAGGLLLSLLPPIRCLPALLMIPALFGGFYLLAASLLQKLLPSSPLPLLQSGKGHSLLIVGIGLAEQSDSALEGMARMICAGHSDCRYQLVLIPSDGSVREAAGEEASAAAIRAKAAQMASRFDCTLEVTFVKRRYESSRKRWKGTPTFSQLATLLWESIRSADTDSSPEAICLLPAEAAILPDTFERLSAALFHPLCPTDSLVFLQSPFSPHPTARLQTLRSCLLQKLNAPADFHGYGILKRDALQAVAACDTEAEKNFPLSPRLSGESLSLVGANRESSSLLFSRDQPLPLFPPLRQTPSLLPWLPLTLEILRPLLLICTLVTNLPPLWFISAVLLSSADLLASALLSFSLSPKRFCLFTLSAWKVLGKELLSRLLLPLRELWDLHPIGGRTGFTLSSLLFGAAVATTHLFAPRTPLFFLGLIWGIAPLLMAEPSPRQALTANQKAACYALAEEIYPLLSDEQKLPPAYKTRSGEASPYTTPSVLGSELLAWLSALDLGLCDVQTAEQKISARLTKLESLPTRCGLPFARYAVDTEDFYKDSTVNSAECGLYALCLAALEAGLRAYAGELPSLSVLADRAARLSDQMDLSLLLTDRDKLCRTLTPSGKQAGEISYLFGTGGITLFAVLSSDSTLSMESQHKRRAFSALCAPIALKKGQLLIRSEQGELWEYLLPSLLLPLPEDSLLAIGGKCALKLCLREARRAARIERRSKPHHIAASEAPILSDPPSFAPKQQGFRRLLCWNHLGKDTPLPQTGSCWLGNPAEPKPLTAPILCLLLEQKPRIALCGLQKLQRTAPMGGFTDPSFEDRIPYAGLTFSLIALASAATARSVRERIKALPRCGVLLPLLNCHREEEREMHSPRARKSEELPVHLPPSLFLLGDANHGLLLRQDGSFSLWEGGKPITALQASDPLLSSRRICALLFSDGNRLLPFPFRPVHRTQHQLSLKGEEISCEILQESNGWCLKLTRAQTSPIELRFLLSPACRKGKPIRLSTHRIALSETAEEHRLVAPSLDNSIALVLELSPSQTLAIGLQGVDSPLTHADPSPFPIGERQLQSLFALPPKEADGFCETPSCMIGGIWRRQTLSLRLSAASQKRDAIERLRTPPTIAADTKGTPFPLPSLDRSLAAMAMEWELNALYYRQSVPTELAIGNNHLARCLDSARQILVEKGFPLAATLPTPLMVNRREGAESLLARLLQKEAVCAQTPLLAPSGEITAPDGFLQILRGRDLPSLCRIYHNEIATLWADPEDLRFSPTLAGDAIPLRLLLARRGEQHLLPASATALSFAAGQAIFSGDGFTLTASLLPKLPFLSIRLLSTDDAKLVLPTLSAPHRDAGDEQLWYLSETQTLSLRTWKESDAQVWLIGTFPRAHDHLYYWIKEKITPQTLPGITQSYHAELRSAATVLTGISPNLPAIPALAAAVLEGTDRSKALLAPICTPAKASALLLRLFTEDQSLLLPAALLLYHAVLGDTCIDDWKIPYKDGRESLYLHAARSLEYAMETAPENPLLPMLTAAFSKLASEHCDSAAPLYAAFEPPSDMRYRSDGIDPLWHCRRQTVLLLAKLCRSNPSDAPAVVSALLRTIDRLPQNAPAAESALLWCGILFGVLGFCPADNGCTLAPMAVEEAYQFRLFYRGEHIIRLFPETPLRTESAEPVQLEEEEEKENISPAPIFSRQNS